MRKVPEIWFGDCSEMKKDALFKALIYHHRTLGESLILSHHQTPGEAFPCSIFKNRLRLPQGLQEHMGYSPSQHILHFPISVEDNFKDSPSNSIYFKLGLSQIRK
ncbi:hypothetical protein Y1Q_0001344 [Alligator mississippiensis]|uniref:Uncharacterized protein n=1 Tax=Alligator mississippiensis TaxID=8496 RepID=A0A151M955_ALLMI|nr:hypothetical protein Y1Q_0001344 [Alligator mississippiensis]